jgi:hypothetical protein
MYDIKEYVTNVVYLLPYDIPLQVETFPSNYCECSDIKCINRVHIKHDIIINDSRPYKFLPLSLRGLIYFKKYQLGSSANTFCKVCGKSTVIETINVGNPSDEGYMTITQCKCSDDENGLI